jgi:hypothetical protein
VRVVEFTNQGRGIGGQGEEVFGDAVMGSAWPVLQVSVLLGCVVKVSGSMARTHYPADLVSFPRQGREARGGGVAKVLARGASAGSCLSELCEMGAGYGFRAGEGES